MDGEMKHVELWEVGLANLFFTPESTSCYAWASPGTKLATCIQGFIILRVHSGSPLLLAGYWLGAPCLSPTMTLTFCDLLVNRFMALNLIQGMYVCTSDAQEGSYYIRGSPHVLELNFFLVQ
jgi:hypothetical protein